MTSKRVFGHALLAEGAPYGISSDSGAPVTLNYTGTGGWGRAACSCGVLSEVLSSAPKRKAWHRQHKETWSPIAKAWSGLNGRKL